MDKGSPAPAWVGGLRAQRMPALWTGGGHCWVRFKRFGMVRYPSNDVGELGADERRELLWRHRSGVLQYHQVADDPAQANASLYLCRDKGYALESLSSNNRSKVRRALKRLEVRQISADEVIATGYAAYQDTRDRHGVTMMTPEQFLANWQAQRHVPDREIWGAWAGADLAAWGVVHRCGRWASISATVSDRAHLRDYPNHALFFTMLEHLMADPEVESAGYGLSSMRSETDRDSLHQFKTSVGLEAIPVRRLVEVHPLLRPVVNQVALSAATAVARRRPGARIPRATKATLEFLLEPDASEAGEGTNAEPVEGP